MGDYLMMSVSTNSSMVKIVTSAITVSMEVFTGYRAE